MNCEQWQQKILLADSGELPESAIVELNDHLSRCADCRRFRGDLTALCTAASTALSSGEPAAKTFSAISLAAERAVARAPRRVLFRTPLVQALAYAAAVALLLGTWFAWPSDGRLERISDVSAILSMVAEEQLPQAENMDGTGGDKELQALAEQLLLIQGFETEETTDAESVSLPPIDLQSRSSDALLPRRCV